MIKPLDIQVSTYKDPKSYHGHTLVKGELIRTEYATIHARYDNDQKMLEIAERKVRQAVYQSLYGELRDSIEEMYGLVMITVPYDGKTELRIRELKKQIDEIMGSGI